MLDATLVTVHGLFSSARTWDRLTEVWRADEALRGLRMHHFDYPSPRRPRMPLSPTRVPDYTDIAQTLAADIAAKGGRLSVADLAAYRARVSAPRTFALRCAMKRSGWRASRGGWTCW